MLNLKRIARKHQLEGICICCKCVFNMELKSNLTSNIAFVSDASITTDWVQL